MIISGRTCDQCGKETMCHVFQRKEGVKAVPYSAPIYYVCAECLIPAYQKMMEVLLRQLQNKEPTNDTRDE